MNRKIILASRPNGPPNEENFKLIEEAERPPDDGEVLCKTLYLSLDPYMRGRMNEGKSYAKPTQVGEVMEAGGISEVINSKSINYKTGDFVVGRTGWQDTPTINANMLRKLNADTAPISTAVGVLGMPGMTAYVGMKNIAQPKHGETLVVAAASGAVGATVGQIGKIYGCRVVGVTSSKEKCSFVKDTLKFDKCINRNDPDFENQMTAACPKGIDIYWENVGGKTFDVTLPLLNDFARIPVCGLISMYNATHLPEGPDRAPLIFRNILTKRLLIRGFIVFDFQEQEEEALEQLTKWVKEGKMIYKEDFVTGLENAPKAFLGLLSGKNFGKLIIRVNKDPTRKNII